MRMNLNDILKSLSLQPFDPTESNLHLSKQHLQEWVSREKNILIMDDVNPTLDEITQFTRRASPLRHRGSAPGDQIEVFEGEQAGLCDTRRGSRVNWEIGRAHV